MEAARFPWPALGVLLIRDCLVTPEELEEVLALQGDDRDRRISSRRLGDVLVERGIVTSAQVSRLVAEQHELPFIDLDDPDSSVPLAVHMPEEVARHHSALPIRVFPDGSLLVVVADPTRAGCFDDIRRALGVPVRFAVAAPDAIEAAIDIASSHALLRDEDEPEAVEDADGDMETYEPIDEGDTPDYLAAAPADEQPRNEAIATESESSWPVLGSLLLRDGLVTEHELSAALAQQRLSSTRRLGEILVARGTLAESEVTRLLAEQHELPFVELSEYDIDFAAASRLPANLAHIHAALPISSLPNGSLLVAVADPTSVVYSDELREALGVPLEFAVAVYGEICVAIDRLAEGDFTASYTDELEVEEVEASVEVEESVEFAEPVELVEPHEPEEPEEAVELEELEEPDTPDEPEPSLFDEDDDHELKWVEPTYLFPGPVPLVMLDGDGETSALPTTLTPEPREDEAEPPQEHAPTATETIEAALVLGACAVHFAPLPEGIAVRARIDGVVTDLETIAQPRVDVFATELSALAGAGRTTFLVGDRRVETRSARVPTLLGDRVIFRVVADESRDVPFFELLAATGADAEVRNALEQSTGLFLICGPTASARTTMLHAALGELDLASRNTLTIEDPVEHVVPEAGQVEVDPLGGVTFASGLHAILRSDPDVVVVGELADGETAQLATRGALDSLVLSSIRAETAAAGARRLLDLGVDPGELSTALVGVAAQRLVDGICVECREPHYATAEEIAELGLPSEEVGRRLLGRSRGCAACDGTGYRGRVGVFEVLPLTDEVRRLIAGGAPAHEIEHAGIAAGMTTLRDGVARLCLDGITTSAEVGRLAPRGIR